MLDCNEYVSMATGSTITVLDSGAVVRGLADIAKNTKSMAVQCVHNDNTIDIDPTLFHPIYLFDETINNVGAKNKGHVSDVVAAVALIPSELQNIDMVVWLANSNKTTWVRRFTCSADMTRFVREEGACVFCIAREVDGVEYIYTAKGKTVIRDKLSGNISIFTPHTDIGGIIPAGESSVSANVEIDKSHLCKITVLAGEATAIQPVFGLAEGESYAVRMYGVETGKRKYALSIDCGPRFFDMHTKNANGFTADKHNKSLHVYSPVPRTFFVATDENASLAEINQGDLAATVIHNNCKMFAIPDGEYYILEPSDGLVSKPVILFRGNDMPSTDIGLGKKATFVYSIGLNDQANRAVVVYPIAGTHDLKIGVRVLALVDGEFQVQKSWTFLPVTTKIDFPEKKGNGNAPYGMTVLVSNDGRRGAIVLCSTAHSQSKNAFWQAYIPLDLDVGRAMPCEQVFGYVTPFRLPVRVSTGATPSLYALGMLTNAGQMAVLSLGEKVAVYATAPLFRADNEQEHAEKSGAYIRDLVAAASHSDIKEAQTKTMDMIGYLKTKGAAVLTSLRYCAAASESHFFLFANSGVFIIPFTDMAASDR